MTRSRNRRDFLASVGTGTAAGFLAELARIRQTHAAEIDPADFGDDALPPADLYDLAADIVYLNHASIGTIPQPVHRAHAAYLALCETNPWLHIWGGAWEAPRERVRAAAARALGCDTDDLAITHNTTEAFNLAAQGLALGPGDEVVFPDINHPGASVAWDDRARRQGIDVRRFPFPVEEVPGLTEEDCLTHYDRAITERTRVLVLPHLDNIVGFRQPVARIAKLARERGVDFIAVDGAQSAGMIPLEVGSLGVDLYATSGHKWLQGPKGTGLCYLSDAARARLAPLIATWGQERWAGSVRVFEDYGTRNFPALLALGDAIDFQDRIGAAARARKYAHLRAHAMTRCHAAHGLAWLSPRDPERGGALFAIGLTRERADAAFERLNKTGGFVFRAFRPPDPDLVRISPNLTTSPADLDRFFDALEAG